MAMAQISKFLLLKIRNFLAMSTFQFEVFLVMLLTMPKSGVNTCTLFFGKACMPKNNMHNVHSKDDVNTPSAIYFSQGDNYVSTMFVLRAIIVYRPLPT